MSMPSRDSTEVARSPLTGGGSVRHIRTIPANDLIEAWAAAFDIDIRPELDGAEAAALFECTETQLQFFHPPRLAGSPRLYDQLQSKLDWYYDYQEKSGGAREVRWEYARAIRHLSGCERVLDLGAGRGAFVELALRRGLPITGIDTSPEAVRTAKSRNLPVERASVEELAARRPGFFDGLCSFQTLEHLAEPRGFLEQLVLLARPGARIVFAVPNAECYQARLPDRDRLLDMPPHHMLRWSRRAFESLTSLFPLDLEGIETEPLAPYNVNSYVKALLTRPAFRTLGIAGSRYPAALLRLLLRLGGHRFCRGANLYARFRRA